MRPDLEDLDTLSRDSISDVEPRPNAGRRPTPLEKPGERPLAAFDFKLG
jgi:hypothetical protein